MTAHHNQSLFFVLKLRVALIFYKALVLPRTFFLMLLYRNHMVFTQYTSVIILGYKLHLIYP